MRTRPDLSGAWIALPVLLLDRLTKLYALSELKGQPLRGLIDGVISLSYRENRGVAFSMLRDAPALVMILSAALLLALAALLLNMRGLPRMSRAGLWAVFGGGLGNLIDRLLYGCVVDFIRTDFVRFAVFNVADACICLGAIVAAVAILFAPKEKEHG